MSVVGGIAGVLLGASAAWACVAATADPFLAAPEPARATAGTPVTLRGGNWGTNAPVELRWGSETGAVLATAVVDREGAFSMSVVVPQAAPGPYYLVAVQGSRRDVQTFEVPAPLSPATQASPNPAPSPQPGPVGPTVVNNRTSGGSPAPAPATPSNPGPSTPAPVTGNSVPSAPAATANSQLSDAGGPLAGLVPERITGSPSPSGALGGTPQPATTSTDSSSAAAITPTDDESAPSPARLVSGDLWSGFTSGDGGLFRGPSLTDGATPSSSGLPGPEMAVALFASGIVAMFGGFAFGELRRRRALGPLAQLPRPDTAPRR